jgi:hypothetical protein
MYRGYKPNKRLNKAVEGINSSLRTYTRMKIYGTSAVNKADKSGHVFIAELRGCGNN